MQRTKKLTKIEKQESKTVSKTSINVEETSSKHVAIDGAGFFPEFEGYGPKTSKNVSEDTSNEVRESPDALMVEKLVSDDKIEKKMFFSTVAKIEFDMLPLGEGLKEGIDYDEVFALVARIKAIGLNGKNAKEFYDVLSTSEGIEDPNWKEWVLRLMLGTNLVAQGHLLSSDMPQTKNSLLPRASTWTFQDPLLSGRGVGLKLNELMEVLNQLVTKSSDLENIKTLKRIITKLKEGVFNEEEVEVEKVVSTIEITTASATTTTVGEYNLVLITLIEKQSPAKPKVDTTASTKQLATTDKDKGQGKNVESHLKSPLKKKEQILDNTQAMMEADYELAQRLQAEEQGELTIEERSKLFVELIDKGRSTLQSS
ncbi:hypothetical protein Tco_0872003 [Tanacetum coccineum]